MTATKKVKDYTLFDGPTGVTCYSRWYGTRSKKIYRVKAKSVKQAYFLASNRVPVGSDGCGLVMVEDGRTGETWVL